MNRRAAQPPSSRIATSTAAAVVAALLFAAASSALEPATAIHTMSMFLPEGALPDRPHLPVLPYLPWWPDPGRFLDDVPAHPTGGSLACELDYLSKCPGGIPLAPPGSDAALCVPAAAAPFLRDAGYASPLPPAPRAAPLDMPAAPRSLPTLAALFSEAGGMKAVAGPLRDTAAAINAAGIWDFKSRQLYNGAAVLSPPALHTTFSILHEGMRGELARTLSHGRIHSLMDDHGLHQLTIDDHTFIAAYQVTHMRFGFGLDPDPEARHDAAARLAAYLNTDILNSANVSLSPALWIDDGFEVGTHFANAARRVHGAPLATVDYGQGPAVLDGIDAWLEERAGATTVGSVPWGALPAPSLPPGDAARLAMLRNENNREFDVSIATVAAFDARWEIPFRQGVPGAGPHARGGQEPQHNTMHTSGTFGYAHSHATQVVRLPYEGGRFSMIVILPDDRGWASHREYPVYPGQIEQWLDEMEPTYLEIEMPEIEVADEWLGHKGPGLLDSVDIFLLPDGLRCLGHPPLGLYAKFDRGLVSVDAAGTRAAHATQVVLAHEPWGGPWAWGGPGITPHGLQGVQPAWSEPDLPHFTVDRPFMLAIYDEPARMILFIGHVPTGAYRTWASG